MELIESKSRRALAYFRVVMVNAAALALSLLLEPILEPNFEAVFLAAVALNAWRSGFRSGVFSTMLGLGSLVLLFLPPHYTMNILSWAACSRLLIFVITAIFVSWLIDRLNSSLREVRLSEARFRVALQHSAIFVYSQDRDLRYTWTYNSRHLPPEALLGRTDDEILGPEAAAPLTALKQQVLTRGSGVREEITFRTGTSEMTFDLTLEPLKSPSGEVAGILGAAIDRTEYRRIERRLRDAERMESVGLLAAGLAHRFNNILQGVIGNISLALVDMEPGKATRLLNDASGAGQRAVGLVTQLLAYAEKSDLHRERTDLSAVVAAFADIIRSSVSEHIVCEFNLRPDLPAIKADPELIEQALVNLAGNAVEAIGSTDGSIVIATGVETASEQRLHNAPIASDRAEPGEFVCLEVRDSGSGMDSSVLAKAFDPFFSTKFLGRGLGLAVVQGIVRRHHGFIEVSSQPGEGSTFRLLFPAIPAPPG